MYRERMFETWKRGLIHLAIVVVMPIIPVIIYLITEGAGRTYLYVLILTVIFSFLYEYLSPSYRKCGVFLKIEGIICSGVLTVMGLGSFFLLLLLVTVEDGNTVSIDLAFWSKILVALFGVPVIFTLIEIIRSFVYDLKSGGFLPDDENIARGAANV